MTYRTRRLLAITLLTSILLVLLGAVAAYADNPEPRAPMRTTRCVDRTEYETLPIDGDGGPGRRELRELWGTGGRPDHWQGTGGYFYAKCGVALGDGYVYVLFNADRSMSVATMEQRDYDVPEDAWMEVGN